MSYGIRYQTAGRTSIKKEEEAILVGIEADKEIASQMR